MTTKSKGTQHHPAILQHSLACAFSLKFHLKLHHCLCSSPLPAHPQLMTLTQHNRKSKLSPDRCFPTNTMSLPPFPSDSRTWSSLGELIHLTALKGTYFLMTLNLYLPL